MDESGTLIKRDFDLDQLNKCTLCPFISHIKSHFQRHLMRSHGIRLQGLENAEGDGPYATLGRVSGTHNDNSNEERKIFKFICGICKNKFHSSRSLKDHKKRCGKPRKFHCTKCSASFDKKRNLNRHMNMCQWEKNIKCQLCTYKCFTNSHMSRHYIDKHNLICKFVDNPDSKQILNGTPYILEEPVEVNELPKTGEAPAFNTQERRRKIFVCSCKQEFAKLKFLHKHRKQFPDHVDDPEYTLKDSTYISEKHIDVGKLPET